MIVVKWLAVSVVGAVAVYTAVCAAAATTIIRCGDTLDLSGRE